MATFKVHGMVAKFEKKLIEGMTSRGYTEEYAKRVFRQLEGFGSYGFPLHHWYMYPHRLSVIILMYLRVPY